MGVGVLPHVTRAPTDVFFHPDLFFLVDLWVYVIMKNRVISVFFEVVNSSATSICSIIQYKDNFALQCLHAHIRWESTNIGWSRACSIGFVFSYKIIVRLIYSGVFKAAMSNLRPAGSMRPSRGFCAAQFCFRCSKSILHTDKLSLF